FERPNDEQEDTSNMEGSGIAAYDDCNYTVEDEVEPMATKIGESVISGGKSKLIYMVKGLLIVGKNHRLI
ncbi:hypothetical protein Tco_1480783, partial [Tanacetum coccineum]